MTEQEALNHILRNGKKDCVYADEYSRFPTDLGMAGYIELWTFCKQQGARDILEWLMAKGLYRDVEKDMREGNGMIDPEARIEAICAQILERFPLAGEPVLSDEVLAKLFGRAQVIFDAIAEYGKTELSADERDVMAIAIIQHIKRRDFREDGKSDNQFWSYIYTQFGYKQENDKTDTQRIYNVLRAAVRGAFLQHDRYWSSGKDTQQYYTSLRLHALAPVQSMESLFEILLFFYTHDLEFNYVPEDPIFKALVNCIASRWDRDTELQNELNVRSNAMASGLKALFSDRKAFMRGYCEHIVQRIDAMVQGIDVLKPDSALDGLLRQWYAKRDEALKSQISRERIPTHGGRRVISSSDSIRLRYVLENRKVCISIPPIRLEDKADVFPWLELYQGENRIYAREMEVYGRLSWTTCEMLIPLDDTDLDYSILLNIEASIVYDGKTLLERDSKLHRPFIVFNDSGSEVSSQTTAVGAYYLFAYASAHIDPGTTEPEWIDNDGQLMRLYIDGSNPVYIDGTELFVSRDRKEDVRCYPSIPRVNELRGRREGGTFNVYPATFKLDIRLPAGRQSLNYRIIIDGILEPLAKYCTTDRQTFVLDVPKTPVKYHSIQIKEWCTGQTTCDFSYAVLPNVICSMERGLIYDDGSPTTVHVHYEGCDITSREYPGEGTDWVTLSADHLVYDLEVKLPLVRGTLLEQNIFKLPSAVWREKIPDTAFVKMRCPPNWNYKLYLGTTTVPKNPMDDSFELGNFIKSYRHRDKSEALTLMMKNTQGQQDKKTLTRIVFEEHFTQTPVSIEDGALVWHPEGRYVGGNGDEFQLIVDIPVEGSPFTYALDLKNGVIDRQFGRDFPYGEFSYRITKKRKSLFGTGADRILFEGALAIGAPEQRRVLRRYMYLTKARCWDLNTVRMINLEMPDTAGCLCNLQYQGNSVPPGENFEYPEYVGDLFFYNPSEHDWQYFNDQEKPGFEWINPVRVWLISEQLLILRTAEGEAPYIDRQYNTIVNRTLNLPAKVLNYRLILPDYFEYRME